MASALDPLRLRVQLTLAMEARLAQRKAERDARSAAASKGHLTRRKARNKAGIVGPAARAE